ncbi:MAG: NAD-dependent epimerase/dehydratase family protein [Chloroflexi bacterium]|nr:NAD-dependent epimerase/dehydratase family protein [Chloroflexota bacterium]
MKNILVIGGSYFLGRVFVEAARELEGYSLHVLNRGRRPLKLSGVNEIVCDRRDAARLRQVLPPLEWDAVVDFCAYDPEDIAVVLGNLPSAVRRYVYISTASVHENSLILPMNEDTPKLTAPLPLPGGDYAYNKWLTEIKVKELCESRGIPHVSLRPAFIYGAYNYAPRESYFFDLIARDEPIIVPSPPQALFSLVSVWDVANICTRCLENDKVLNSAYIVAAEELVSYDRLTEVLEEITSRKLNVQRQATRIIETRRIPLPFPLSEHLVYTGELLQKTLDYRYMSFREGMARTYNWFFQK